MEEKYSLLESDLLEGEYCLLELEWDLLEEQWDLLEGESDLLEKYCLLEKDLGFLELLGRRIPGLCF